jgi:hypothetical protein
MLVITTLALHAKSMRCLSAPVSEIAQNEQEIVHWVADPQTRGTLSLLLSCVITLLLCIWTSLHLNIPEPEESAGSQLAGKLKWMAMALLAPELVVYTAWRQWIGARALCKEINDILDMRSVHNGAESVLFAIKFTDRLMSIWNTGLRKGVFMAGPSPMGFLEGWEGSPSILISQRSRLLATNPCRFV